jgi:hypothetical protein
MNKSSDIDRVLSTWMADGPAAIPDRVVDVVAARIGVQGQRRMWPFPRRTNVTTQIKLIAALAAALVVAVVGYSLLPPQGSVGGPTTAPTASPQPTTVASAAAVVDLPEGTLGGGRYRMDLAFVDPGYSIVAEVPAGWSGNPDIPAIVSPEASNGQIVIAQMVAESLFTDPCHWDLNGTGLDQDGDVVVGPTVNDLVAALKANTSYSASAATPVSISGFDGQQLELQLPGDDVLSTCDKHGPGSPFSGTAYFVFSRGFYAQGPNNRWQLAILDVDGTRLINMISIGEGTPQADIDAAQAIVESFEITP